MEKEDPRDKAVAAARRLLESTKVHFWDRETSRCRGCSDAWGYLKACLDEIPLPQKEED